MNAHHQQLTDLLEQALKEWHRIESRVDLRPILPRLYQQALAASRPPGQASQHSVVNQLTLNLLDAMTAQDEEGVDLLRRRYINGETGFAVANILGISESHFYRRRLEALASLAELALEFEAKAQESQIGRLERRLEPPTYQQLFGIDQLQARLSQRLTSTSAIKLISLTGIGGIGKTALADALTREAIRAGHFAEVAWITARQQQFGLAGVIRKTDYPILSPDELIRALDRQLHEDAIPPRSTEASLAALKARFADASHLIVIDNLETATDLEILFPLLRDLSRNACILLTSREGFYDQSGVLIENLTELNPVDAAAFIRDEATRRGIDPLAAASAEVITSIYELAGGNPLALKLLIGQIQVRSLSIVLADFEEARGCRVEALYEFIYRQAWELLDNQARRVLLAMPIVAKPAATLGQLTGTTRLTQDDLYEALDQLIRLSLVTVGGPLDERCYQIHRLTETFLHKQVAKWM
jgi:hypothetical protein